MRGERAGGAAGGTEDKGGDTTEAEGGEEAGAETAGGGGGEGWRWTRSWRMGGGLLLGVKYASSSELNVTSTM